MLQFQAFLPLTLISQTNRAKLKHCLALVDFAGDPAEIAILKEGQSEDRVKVADAAARLTAASLAKMLEFEGSSTAVSEAGGGKKPGEKVMGLCKRITTYRSSIKEVTGNGNVLLKVPLLEYKEYMRKKKEKESPPPGTVTQMDAWLGNKSSST